jgi:hypothetical protein
VTDALGQTDSVYASSDLATWTLLTTVVNTTGTFVVNDPEAANVEQRFYRVTDYGVTTDPAGFITLLIADSTGGQSRAFSFLGISMVNPVSYQGTITSVGNYSVTDANATWSANEFNGTNGEFFIEITSGPYAGLMADILANDAAGETLTTDDDLSSLLTGGELYRIRKHRTLGDVFGENNESGLNGGSSISEADEVSVLNPVTQTFSTYGIRRHRMERRHRRGYRCLRYHALPRPGRTHCSQSVRQYQPDFSGYGEDRPHDRAGRRKYKRAR